MDEIPYPIKPVVFLIAFALALGLIITLGNGLDRIHQDLQQGNLIECIKLRESADSLGPADREACPYDLGGNP